MIIVMGSIRMGDGEIARLHADMVTQMAATQAEDGCELYVYSCDVADPNLLRIAERWRDRDALAAHMKAPHVAAFGKILRAAKVESVDFQSFEASAGQPL